MTGARVFTFQLTFTPAPAPFGRVEHDRTIGAAGVPPFKMSNIFLDVGAHQGTTITDFIERDASFDGWRLLLVEPSPRNLPGLLAKAAAVSSRYKVEIFPFGLAGSPAVRPLHLKADEGGRGDSVFEWMASDHETINELAPYRLHVATQDIATFILEHTEAHDEIALKIDAEGVEYELLARLIGCPAALARVRRVWVEWHTIKSAVPIHGPEKLTSMFGAVGIPLERWMF